MSTPSEAAKDLAALRRTDPVLWRATIRDALVRSNGFLIDRAAGRGAATILGIAAVTLKVWIGQDAVLSKIARPGRGRPAAKKTRRNKGS